ncbi:hypothetical protein KO493_01855 [Tamlana agarivorans]|uniref:Uncharacterized protein n=1 Tax=Pseudotamlana agarivorans TaxID=481183 RepID=A0ACC5U5E1_9FLAO|nr:hypothetical protein [Tamlana agarivorans]MBU2949435.1 hypothetical protein [Tamlana agarivorans]
MLKKYLLLFSFAVITSTCLSQKCKNETDPFTSVNKTFFNYEFKTVYFEIVDEAVAFEITFSYIGERNFEFNENSEVLFKLENGTILNLKTNRKAIPKLELISYASNSFGAFGGMSMTTSRSQNYSTYSFSFLLSKRELNQLAESKIELIRIPDTDEGKFHDLEPKGETKKKIKAIKKGASCISSYMI